MRRAPLVPSLLLTLVAFGAAPACDSKDEKSEPVKGNADVEAEVNEEASEAVEKKGRKKRAKKERGSGSVLIGDELWEAEACKVRLKGDRWSLSCSHTDMSDGNVSRQEVKLVVTDYKGPGKYKASHIGSMFIGVGMNVAEVTAAEKDDAKTTKVATDAIKGATTIPFIGAEVEITAADDTFIDGTFSWSGGPQSKKPDFKNGKFHAVLKK